MGIWRNVTDTFSEERRHYSNAYLEIREVYDESMLCNSIQKTYC